MSPTTATAATVLLPFQPDAMTAAQLAAVSYLARYCGHTHGLYAAAVRRWFGWCQTNGLDPLAGIQRAHVELYIRHLQESALRDSSVNTMMHGVRGFFRFAHIDGLITADPAVYARLPKVHADETHTQGLDRLELIRFLQVAQTVTVHHGALAYLLGINALCASEAAAVRIEDYEETLRGHRVLHLVGKGSKPATMPLTVPVLRVWRRASANEPKDHWSSARRRASRSTAATSTGWSPGSPRPPAFRGTSVPTRCGTQRSPTPSTPASRSATRRSSPGTPTHAPPSTTTAPAATSTAMASTSSPPTSPAYERRGARRDRTSVCVNTAQKAPLPTRSCPGWHGSDIIRYQEVVRDG
jgi:site-specific recombinase XerC